MVDAPFNGFWILYFLNLIFPLLEWLELLCTSTHGHTGRSSLAGPYWPRDHKYPAIVKTLIPTCQWNDGLHPVQLELVSTILDGQDILCCTATGDGKSAAFAIPCLILIEYNAHPEAYPAGLPTRKRPIGVVITPTKGLANNIVGFSPFFNVSCSRISRFSNYRKWMYLLSHTATKPWVKHERLESVWQIWLRNVLDGRWSVWTRSTCATKSGGKSRRVRSFGPTSCLGASTRSTWLMSGVSLSVLHSRLLGLSCVVDFLLPYLLSVSRRLSSQVHRRFQSVKAWASLMATSNSSGGLMSVRILSLLSSSSLVDWTVRHSLIYFHT